MKTLLAATVIGAGALFAGSAFAQTGTLVEVGDNVTVQPFNIAAGLLDDIDVYTAEGVEVGDVDKLVGPDRETATHFVVDFDDDGGFPDRDLLVPLEALTLDGNRLIISLSPEEVAALPVWDD